MLLILILGGATFFHGQNQCDPRTHPYKVVAGVTFQCVVGFAFNQWVPVEMGPVMAVPDALERNQEVDEEHEDDCLENGVITTVCGLGEWKYLLRERNEYRSEMASLCGSSRLRYRATATATGGLTGATGRRRGTGAGCRPATAARGHRAWCGPGASSTTSTAAPSPRSTASATLNCAGNIRTVAGRLRCPCPRSRREGSGKPVNSARNKNRENTHA